MNKLDMRTALGICTIGVVIVAIGSFNLNSYTTRLAGVIVTGAGLIALGKRLYDRIQEKAKAKALATRILIKE